jgi:hypothetical protein
MAGDNYDICIGRKHGRGSFHMIREWQCLTLSWSVQYSSMPAMQLMQQMGWQLLPVTCCKAVNYLVWANYAYGSNISAKVKSGKWYRILTGRQSHSVGNVVRLVGQLFLVEDGIVTICSSCCCGVQCSKNLLSYVQMLDRLSHSCHLTTHISSNN